ncbi:MAG: hypothetical protein ABFD97_22080 [Syntrophobacter sp.]
MTTRTVSAVYERGGFRPGAPVNMHLTEGQRVCLAVATVLGPGG